MIKLVTFTNQNEKLLEFNFKDIRIDMAPKEPYWITIVAAKQTLTICGNAFIAYDESAQGVTANTQDFNFAKSWIQTYYKDNQKILLISSPSDEPLFIFYGTTISISNIKNNYAEFSVNGKKIFINNLHWVILTKNATE